MMFYHMNIKFKNLNVFFQAEYLPTWLFSSSAFKLQLILYNLIKGVKANNNNKGTRLTVASKPCMNIVRFKHNKPKLSLRGAITAIAEVVKQIRT